MNGSAADGLPGALTAVATGSFTALTVVFVCRLQAHSASKAIPAHPIVLMAPPVSRRTLSLARHDAPAPILPHRHNLPGFAGRRQTAADLSCAAGRLRASGPAGALDQ